MIFYFTFYFNPRSREGSDKKEDVSSADSGISIHAPAKGATNPRQVISAPYRISIHAPAKGATRISHPLLITSKFQSTLPRRERRKMLSCSPGLHCHFNPRSREGSDKNHTHLSIPLPDFNPRSREGSDSGITPQRIPRAISIHAPAKGATVRCLYVFIGV